MCSFYLIVSPGEFQGGRGRCGVKSLIGLFCVLVFGMGVGGLDAKGFVGVLSGSVPYNNTTLYLLTGYMDALYVKLYRSLQNAPCPRK